MSGHSKWAQIKHKKALTDAKKGKMFSKLARMITVAAKEKGADPTMNSKLRAAVEKARSLGMPSENVERAIKRGAGGETGANLEEVLYEALGPGGSAVLIKGITDSRNRTTAEIKHLLAEHGGRLAEKGSVEWMFKKVYTFEIEKPDYGGNSDDLELILIDAGADDIEKSDNALVARISPLSADKFKKNLGAAGINARDEYFDYIPANKIGIDNKDTRRKFDALIEDLDNHDDVQEIYTNVL